MLAEREGEDLNVEHGQLLLFLFHSLQLMQKKSTSYFVLKVSFKLPKPRAASFLFRMFN